jgi:hypothetical protein
MTDTKTKSQHRKLTQDELLAELLAQFGDDPMNWAFQCPSCDTVTTGQDLRDALKAHPRTNRNGEKTVTSDLLGQECIGRTDPDQGCNWAAYGLFRGPWEVTLNDGESMWCFPIAAEVK